LAAPMTGLPGLLSSTVMAVPKLSSWATARADSDFGSAAQQEQTEATDSPNDTTANTVMFIAIP